MFSKARMRLVPFLLLASCIAVAAHGQVDRTFINQEDEEKAKQKTSELTWADKNEMQRRVEAVELLGQRHYGQSLRNDVSDLRLLQRIANDKLIKQSDTERLQALGVVLGNTLERELGLEWKVYNDEVGRSRALCVPDTEHCLFPITMLSRRLEVGLGVNVQRIYNEAVETIDPYLPDHNAYDGVKADPRERPSWIDEATKSKPPIRIRVQ
ncbi:DUF3806 domain-containing protein [Gilvimarinus sp. F26214L]|uniref:DUF3806 domain-containing protein n=1 Tax=Gilvimarinus sp. DZF01 TaxID=3461371 RepID=UPI00404607EF